MPAPSHSHVPMLLSQKHLTILFLSALKVELTDDYAGAMLRYQLSRGVADVILSFSSDDIVLIAEQSGLQNLLRVANSNNTAFWADMKAAVTNSDRTAISMALIQSLLVGVPAAAGLPS